MWFEKNVPTASLLKNANRYSMITLMNLLILSWLTISPEVKHFHYSNQQGQGCILDEIGSGARAQGQRIDMNRSRVSGPVRVVGETEKKYSQKRKLPNEDEIIRITKHACRQIGVCKNVVLEAGCSNAPSDHRDRRFWGSCRSVCVGLTIINIDFTKDRSYNIRRC